MDASRRAEHPPAGEAGDDRPVLPDRVRDEEDRGWGDEPDGRRDLEWYRRERPPHHDA